MMVMKIPSSYDIVGSREKAVAIIEIPEELKDKEKEIAERILARHKNVKSVLKKVSGRKGIFRIRDYEFLVGDPNTEVVHKESGCRFKLDPKKVYFSPREGTERLRIAKQVKTGERIMLMFAGVGVYGIIIAKKKPGVKKIICVEINPFAFGYMKENISLNKVNDKLIPILGDVKQKCKDWYGKCDRVIMPLPHEAWKFLGTAYRCLKPEGGTIHLYLIEREESIENKVEKIIENFKKKIKKKIVYRIRKVLPYAPRTNKYCIDIRIL
jgi:tRNA (guanine37-N1)-methyltransferase